jgi:hypothetical protein
MCVVGLACLLPACGESGARAGRPDVVIGPVAPITFVFHNGTGSNVYVSWAAGRAPIHVLRDAKELTIDPACAPLCESACACLACPAPEQKVMRVEPGADLKVVWEATLFRFQKCDQAPGCTCAESWPATAGSYQVSLAASAGVIGGEPDTADPRILKNATIDQAAATCAAGTDFELVGASEFRMLFECQ